jgi:hypothetical protein
MGLDDCNPTAAPMEEGLHLIKASTKALVDATEFRSVVGALRYLVHTRPNLAHCQLCEQVYGRAPGRSSSSREVDLEVYCKHSRPWHELCLGTMIVIMEEMLRTVSVQVVSCSIWEEAQLLVNHRSRNLLLSPCLKPNTWRHR